MNVAVIGVRGGWSTEALGAELARKGAGGEIIQLDEISYDLAHLAFTHPNHDLEDFDAFIVKKMGLAHSPYLGDELALLESMERRGYRFFSKPSALRRMISRLGCTICLRDNGIPMPPTFVTQNPIEAEQWSLERLPVILKPLYSTKARGMVVLNDPATLANELREFLESGETIFYLQQKLDLAGEDYGVAFLGGDYIGTYARVGDGSSWHTGTRTGRQYGAFAPPPEYVDLACEAQKPFGLDFACVDLAVTEEMGPVVLEVSAFGGFQGLLDGADIDAAALLANHVMSALRTS